MNPPKKNDKNHTKANPKWNSIRTLKGIQKGIHKRIHKGFHKWLTKVTFKESTKETTHGNFLEFTKEF
ncbi:hypothetical protein, partial [Serratia ureilytica]|uniref:hypothetical protein n=1 Tax=Serratia ureilytica TaxID=300181 RepID=UPI001C3FB8BD